MALWDPSQLGSAFFAGFRVLDTAGANAGAEITQVAGAVGTWSDWSGNGRHVTQGNTSNQPAYGATSFNTSYPGVTFGNSSLTRSITALSAGTLVSVFVAGRVSNSGSDNRIVSMGVAGSGGDYVGSNAYIPLLRNSGNASISSYYGGSGYLNSASIAYDTPAVFGAVPSGTQHTAYANGTGTSGAFTFPSGFAPDSLAIGADATVNFVSSPLVGILSEVVIVTGVLTTADIDRINGYLAWKYGLQGSLPSGHTYKSAAPTVSGGGTTVSGTGAASGASTVTGVGSRQVSAVTFGLSTVTGVGASLARATASSAGASAVSGLGSAAGSVGASVGASAVTGAGAASTRATASAAGTGAATGVGASRAASTAVSSGTAAASGVGSSTSTVPTGTAVGAGAASGVGRWLATATGASVGSGVAAGAAQYIANVTGSASGIGAVAGVPIIPTTVNVQGSADGAAIVFGVGFAYVPSGIWIDQTSPRATWTELPDPSGVWIKGAVSSPGQWTKVS